MFRHFSFTPSSASQVYDFGYDSNLLPTHLMFATFEYMQANQPIGTFQTYTKITEEEVNYASTTYGLSNSQHKVRFILSVLTKAFYGCFIVIVETILLF